MPFKSKAQRRYCYFLKSKGENGTWDCKEFEKDTPKKLPEKVKSFKEFMEMDFTDHKRITDYGENTSTVYLLNLIKDFKNYKDYISFGEDILKETAKILKTNEVSHEYFDSAKKNYENKKYHEMESNIKKLTLALIDIIVKRFPKEEPNVVRDRVAESFANIAKIHKTHLKEPRDLTQLLSLSNDEIDAVRLEYIILVLHDDYEEETFDLIKKMFNTKEENISKLTSLIMPYKDYFLDRLRRLNAERVLEKE